MAVDAPLYSLSIYDNFTTLNEEELDAFCSQEYRSAWQVKAAGMVTTLNAEIASGNICSGGDEKFEMISSSTTFFSQETEVDTFFPKLQQNKTKQNFIDQIYAERTTNLFILLIVVVHLCRCWNFGLDYHIHSYIIPMYNLELEG